jgi:hypothetical protein
MGRNTARRYGAAFRAAGLLDGPVDSLPELDALRVRIPLTVITWIGSS